MALSVKQIEKRLKNYLLEDEGLGKSPNEVIKEYKVKAKRRKEEIKRLRAIILKKEPTCDRSCICTQESGLCHSGVFCRECGKYIDCDTLNGGLCGACLLTLSRHAIPRSRSAIIGIDP